MEYRLHLLVAHCIQERTSETYIPNKQQARFAHQHQLVRVFLCIIIKISGEICALTAGHVTIDDVHPVLLNWCDNISACAWVNYKRKESLIDRRLALVFVGLLLNSKMGIQGQYFSPSLNFN